MVLLNLWRIIFKTIFSNAFMFFAPQYFTTLACFWREIVCINFALQTKIGTFDGNVDGVEAGDSEGFADGNKDGRFDGCFEGLSDGIEECKWLFFSVP